MKRPDFSWYLMLSQIMGITNPLDYDNLENTPIKEKPFNSFEYYIKEYKLIQNKESNLSYSKRKAIIETVEFLLHNGKISKEDLED